MYPNTWILAWCKERMKEDGCFLSNRQALRTQTGREVLGQTGQIPFN